GGVGPRPPPGLAVEPAPRRPPPRRELLHARKDVTGAHRRAASNADRAAPRARDRADGVQGRRAPRARRRGRVRRRAAQPPLSGRRGAAGRARPAPPARQARRRGRHARERAGDSRRGMTRRTNLALAAVLAVPAAGGVAALLVGEGRAAVVVWAHGAAGFGLLALVRPKSRI